MPLSALEVEHGRPFDGSELLYRRLGRQELNTKGEIDPTRLNGISFRAEVQSAPSVMRSDFCSPADVLNILCSEKDVSDWLVYYVRVDGLPKGIVSGDKSIYDFFPVHVPLPTCGAHSVIASKLAGGGTSEYRKPSSKVINDLKVKLAIGLQPIGQAFSIDTREPISAALAISP